MGLGIYGLRMIRPDCACAVWPEHAQFAFYTSAIHYINAHINYCQDNLCRCAGLSNMVPIQACPHGFSLDAVLDGFSPRRHQQTRSHEIFISTRAQFVLNTGNIFC